MPTELDGPEREPRDQPGPPPVAPRLWCLTCSRRVLRDVCAVHQLLHHVQANTRDALAKLQEIEERLADS